MEGYSTQGQSWGLNFTYKNAEYRGSAQKMWVDDVPFFETNWKEKDDPDPAYNAALFPRRGNPVNWKSDVVPLPQDMIDAVGRAIEGVVISAGFDIFAPPTQR